MHALNVGVLNHLYLDAFFVLLVYMDTYRAQSLGTIILHERCLLESYN
jgi:hypothetical protein